MIEGERVYLEAIEKKDLPKLMEWRNREDFRKYFREYKDINTEMQNKWFETSVLNDNSTIMFSIKSVDSNKLLGCCGLCYINWIHRNADLSIYIGWENAYIDEEGFAEESCKLLQDYGFNQLGLHRIWTEIYEFDEKKKKLYEKLNFHVDGILRDNYYYDGKWWNSYMFSILNCL
ncbi:MAG: GNAT family N-acetyltransferase [Candidatus Cloacimonetes bacterium]|jgi:hypothetical protein|nr:GNAT family N-acetyltransferase [Candidatus Cloacimonadota bacterium]MDY0230780.1 GNAT family protein [Candidatus Cloacimonadaceae bacterium]